MTEQFILRNARIVGPDREFEGSVSISNGFIAEVLEGSQEAGLDLNGDYLLPGFVDVHTDHFEKHAMPRSGVMWNLTSALCSHDAAMIATGTTTVFDSLLAGGAGNKTRRELLVPAVKALDAAREHGLLKADHFLHIRCDIVETKSIELFEKLVDNANLKFVTIIDDLPAREAPARAAKVHEKRRGLPNGTLAIPFGPTADEDFDTAIARRERITELCQQREIVVANHDDTKASHVEHAASLGATVSEFPLTMEAVEAARNHNQKIICGAPNLVRGKSHNGMVAVSDIVRANMLDVLCSDYVPSSLLQAIFLLRTDDFGWSLPKAVALATREPAKLFGLDDRGAIEKGLCADLVRVQIVDRMPVVHTVWKAGQIVFTQRSKVQRSDTN
ncbi:alpha-D-ribose 1-methylphosphonate 5-triphosphate diphosphatase [Rhizobium miluonense]|uniref:Alpha-D-ribose 1-methylphosphonate 5-triphosphate diphosphatase n=1 Tax=Rhizobium miluonense TaxID=411945 RepID=A0A1C3WDD8_9HYPH|nr:alpha-D-ribose 1-methylphosphonate 5-triphosphate diphosphatase [Rhizobium miluonense]SCB38020.1 alpha-D-ribose 1-methylphosphonate 5-triphosphate diphosphatase [Rhizobium miluonense]